MANNAADPDYMMQAMTNAALEKLIANPATDPDTTPPAPGGEAFSLRQTSELSVTATQFGLSSGDAPVYPTQPTPPPTPPAEPVVQVSEEKLTPEVQGAMAVLEEKDIVEKVDENTWRVV